MATALIIRAGFGKTVRYPPLTYILPLHISHIQPPLPWRLRGDVVTRRRTVVGMAAGYLMATATPIESASAPRRFHVVGASGPS
jgi:hypothetical protein